MNTYVHIERLILDGLHGTSGQGSLVQAAVEADLMRFLAEQSLRHSSNGAVPRLSAGSIQLAEDSKPSQLGSQIARAIYGSLTPALAWPSQSRSSGGASA